MSDINYHISYKLEHLPTTPNNNISDFIPALYLLFCVKMSVFRVKKPKKRHLREILFYFFTVKKSAVESHRLLIQVYGKAAISQTTCRDWFQNASEVIILMWKTKNVLEGHKWLKIQKHYSMMIHVKRKKNL